MRRYESEHKCAAKEARYESEHKCAAKEAQIHEKVTALRINSRSRIRTIVDRGNAAAVGQCMRSECVHISLSFLLSCCAFLWVRTFAALTQGKSSLRPAPRIPFFFRSYHERSVHEKKKGGDKRSHAQRAHVVLYVVIAQMVQGELAKKSISFSNSCVSLSNGK